MFLGLEDLPFAFVAMTTTSAIEFKLSAWPPCSDLGFDSDNNLLLLRYCAREYWNYLQVFRRKADLVTSAPFQPPPLTLPAALHRTPSCCRIGPALLLEIAQQPAESIRLLVAAVHVHVSLTINRSCAPSCSVARDTLFCLQSSAPHVQAHGVCALFPAFLLFVGRFAGSIMWTKVPFSRDIVSWRQDHVVLLQNSMTTNWFVAACDSSDAIVLSAEINRCLDQSSASGPQAMLSATFDTYLNSTPSHGMPASAVPLGRSLDSTRLARAATHPRLSSPSDSAGVVLPETLLFGEHRWPSVCVLFI